MKVFVTAFLLSFGILAQASNLSVSVGPQSPYVLPVPLRSCSAEAGSASHTDLAGNTIEYTRFQYAWTGTNTYTMQAMVLSFEDTALAGGKYTCIIAGDELSYVLPAGGKTIDPSEVEPKEARCSLRCGSLSFAATAPSHLQINGQLRVIGTEMDANGNSAPVNTVVPISMTYEKF